VRQKNPVVRLQISGVKGCVKAVFVFHAVAWKAKKRTAAFAVPALHRKRHRPEGSPVNSGHCSEQKELENSGGRLWLLHTTAMSE